MTLPKDYVLDAEIQAKGLDWMTAEIKRLRAALEQFLSCFNCSEWEDEPMVFAAMQAAREALSSSEAPSLAGGEK